MMRSFLSRNVRSCRSTRTRRRTGFTLVELLVTVVLTLMLVFSVVTVFQWLGDGITLARATLEISGQLRTAAYRYKQDIAGLTVPARPLTDANSHLGYLEIIEGAMSDANVTVSDALNTNPVTGELDTTLGDIDDIIMFTARSGDRPFVGRLNGKLIESYLAEIVWWTIWKDRSLDPNNPNGPGNGYRDPGEVTLYRRVFLIRPDFNVDNITTDMIPGDARAYVNATNTGGLSIWHNANDVSVRLELRGGNVVPVFNSLADLSVRANRFAHLPFQTEANFPNLLDARRLLAQADLGGAGGNHLGEDVILTDLLAFDIQVYDPYAPLQSVNIVVGSVAVSPSDRGWDAGTAPNATTPRGAYVNMNYAGDTSVSHPTGLNTEQTGFSGPPRSRSKLVTFALPWPLAGGNSSVGMYDTWTFDYERDGIDQDNDNVVDQAINGLDDNNANGVDDPSERETEPPYSVPLRGIKVTFRIIEFSTLQPRQTSVITDFVPE